MGHCLAGTTDVMQSITHNPEVPQEDVDFICNEMKQIFGKDFDFKSNIVSTWSGIRPLVISSPLDLNNIGDGLPPSVTKRISKVFERGLLWLAQVTHPNKNYKTGAITRNHAIEKSSSEMYSLMGGKWTSFRKMG